MNKLAMVDCRPPGAAFWFFVIVLPALLAGCEEFATPAELAKPQILAIRADPPALPPGQSAVLTILVADQNGAIAAPDVAWESVPPGPGMPALGAVSTAEDGAVRYDAPAEIPANPALAAIQARVRVGALELTALKGVVIGSLPLRNLEITALRADEADILDSSSLVVSAGQTVALEVVTEPPAGESTLFAWYSTAGAIERYQSNPIEMVARPERGTGWLFAVVRDGRGGVDWRAVRVTVE